MRLTRRQFLKIFGASSIGLGTGITGLYNPRIINALAADDAKPPVLWLQGSGCNGCSVSLLNTVHPKIAEILIEIISLRYHPTLMAASGSNAFDIIGTIAREFKGKFILVVEGGIPTAENGIYCTIGSSNAKEITLMEQVAVLAPDARALIAVGTCAAYGGIPRGKPNPTGVKGLAELTDKPVINVSGCPAHPDWVVGTLVHVLLFGMPELIKDGRPLMFYGKNLHENCPNYACFSEGKFAEKLGDDGCLVQTGCKGPMSFADCPRRHWNAGVNWCIGSGAGCIACCEPGFPDAASPMYAVLEEYREQSKIV